MTELLTLESVIDTVLLDGGVDSIDEGTVVNIDKLAEDHAKSTGKYRSPNYTECSGCNRRYLNVKYLRYMLANDIRKIDIDTALVLMHYNKDDFLECCMNTVMSNRDPIVTRVQDIDLKSLVIHYCMSRGIPLSDDLLLRLGVEDSDTVLKDYIENYKSPSIDLSTAITLDEWIESDRTISDLNVNVVLDDANDLDIDRYCTYLKECTSCGTPNEYAYLYWMLTRLNIEPEEIFLDYRVYRPCCRSTYMSPIMKPIEYEHERMIQNFTGLERTRRRESEGTVVTIPGVVPTGRGTTRMTRTLGQMSGPPPSTRKSPPTLVPKTGTTGPKTAPKSGTIGTTGPKRAPPKLAPKTAPKTAPKRAPAKLTVRR